MEDVGGGAETIMEVGVGYEALGFGTCLDWPGGGKVAVVGVDEAEDEGGYGKLLDGGGTEEWRRM